MSDIFLDVVDALSFVIGRYPEILSAIAVGLAGVIVSIIMRRFALKLKESVPPVDTPGRRIQQSIARLSDASREVDRLIQDVTRDINSHQVSLENLETRNKTLLQEERSLMERVQKLKEATPEVVEYFQQLSMEAAQQMERRRGRRDITMFILGISSTTAIAIALRFLA